MVPIVVSRILRVHGLSGHEPGSMNLKNKQGTDGGVLAGSPMLKLVKEIGSVLTVSLAGVYFHMPFFLALPPLFMKKWVIGFQNEREVGASLALQPFFLLGNQVVRVFRLKDRLIILWAILYEVCERICSQVVRNQLGNHWPAIFLKMAAG